MPNPNRAVKRQVTMRLSAGVFLVSSARLWTSSPLTPHVRGRPFVTSSWLQMSSNERNGTTMTPDAEQNGTGSDFKFSEEPSLETIRRMQAKFVEERNWDQYHEPRNLLLALVGEVGELSEIFQWKGEVKTGLPDWSAKEKQRVAQEMSDIVCYLVRLADKCRVDLPRAIVDKIQENAVKYPAAKVWGDSRKYDEYERDP